VNQTVVDRLLPLVEAYALGRRHQKDLRAKLRGKPCEHSRGMGCHFTEGLDPNDRARWCQSCVEREPVWQEFAERKRKNREILARIQVLGLRLSMPDAPPEPEPVKELLELMTTGEP